MASIFSKIVAGEIPAHKIAENEKFYAFLDISPIQKGHTLVIPKQEIDYIFDIEDSLLAELHIFAKKIAHAIQQSIPCQRVAMMVLGLEVPHAHIHLIPINTEIDLKLNTPRLKLSNGELSEIAQNIQKHL